MPLHERLEKLAPPPAKILIFDIETQRAIVETFDLWPKFIHINRIIRPSRILCISARHYGVDKNIFYHAWRDDDEDAYRKMITAFWKLYNEADFAVTWNGDRFDIQWVQAEFTRLGLERPRPPKSIDLIKLAKRHFKAGLLSLKLDWSSRHWFKDSKTAHGGRDLWHDIRYGTTRERRDACKTMREYCIHDTELTETVLERYLPWTPINMSLYRKDTDKELLYCTKCGESGHLQQAGHYYTSAFAYQQYRCASCGGLSRGKRAKITTELRPIN